ncbi:MAG: DUF2492 family protein [Akkermansiaceae bacterium]|nr:DUF2492 family protein [Akkermansiaceae bacterium]
MGPLRFVLQRRSANYHRPNHRKGGAGYGGHRALACISENGMTPAEAVTFLENRGKFIPTDESMKCSH